MQKFEILICDPFKYIKDSPILITCICMGKSIRIQRVKVMLQKRKLTLPFMNIYAKLNPL